MCKLPLSRKEQVTYLLIQQPILYTPHYKKCGFCAHDGTRLIALEADCLLSATTNTVAVEASSTHCPHQHLSLLSLGNSRLPFSPSLPLMRKLARTLVTCNCATGTYLLKTGARSARAFHGSPGTITCASYSGARPKWEN